MDGYASEWSSMASTLTARAEQRRYDEARRAWLRERGWEIVVVRKEDFSAARVKDWTDELRALIQERRRVRGNLAVRRWRRDVAGH